MTPNKARLIRSLVLPLLVLLRTQTHLPAAEKEPAENPFIKTLNTPREFPAIFSRDEWQARAKDIREHVLVSCGLWPMPDRTPLDPHIFGKIERDGYSVEKVYIRTMPGFYLAGNLYRPLGRGKGPFPGILNPHGHWKEGRLADTKDGSAAARCISFARQGMVAFTYDMVGYNDTHFAKASPDQPSYDNHRSFGAARGDQLWSISLMGLQTWNSIRALDFLESLPDVDRKRLACTGESGGGTQTFMLGSVEDRLAAQAPIVMVSHTMQGGCSCENAPGLRVEYSNMELAAAAAPRPQLLVAATGDWTKMTLTVEGPAIAHVYDLFNARDHFDYVRFDFGHNYNQTSREAVYSRFGKWLLHNSGQNSLKEAPYQKEPDAELRVFPDGKVPDDAMTREQFTESLRKLHQAQWEAMIPQSKAGMEKLKQVMLPAWRHNLQVEWPALRPEVAQTTRKEIGEFSKATLSVTRCAEEGSLMLTYWEPRYPPGGPARKLVVLASPDEVPASSNEDVGPSGLLRDLLQRHIAVMEVAHYSGRPAPDPFANFYTTYNRTKTQQRVRDLLTICGLGKRMHSQVILLGSGAAGFYALLASPAASAVIADVGVLGNCDEQALLSPELFCPGILTFGVFEGPALLAAPHPLLVHHLSKEVPAATLRSGYKALHAENHLKLESERVPDEALVNWVSAL
jgi:hypothetical protein